MMFWKDQLAKEILRHESIDYDWLIQLQKDYPSLRVKTIDAKGTIPVIQLSGNSEWLKPSEWANNHVASLRQRYLEEHARLTEVGSDPSAICSRNCAAVSELETRLLGNPDELSQLQRHHQKALSNYKAAMDFMVKLYDGEKMPQELTFHIHKWKKGDKGYIF